MNLIIKSQINERRQIPLKGRFERRFNEGKSEDGNSTREDSMKEDSMNEDSMKED